MYLRSHERADFPGSGLAGAQRLFAGQGSKGQSEGFCKMGVAEEVNVSSR